MSFLSLDVDASQLNTIVSDLGAYERLAQLALNSTLNKMAAWLRAKSVPGLAGAANVPQKIIRRRMKTFRLARSPSGSSLTLWYGLDAVGMIYLGAKQNSSGVNGYGGRFIKSAFIAKGRNGGRHVFKRRGKARLKIDKQTAGIVDPAEAYLEDNLVGSAEFQMRFFTIFERELTWRMQTRK